MTPIRLLAAIMNSLRSFRVLLRRDVRVAFGLIAHERDPAVLHDRHVRVHLGLVHLLAAHGDAALVEALDAGRATELLELRRHLAASPCAARRWTRPR